MSRRRSALILVFGLALFVTCAVEPAPIRAVPPEPGHGDVATFQAILTRLTAGEPYYAVFGDELRKDHYPARSIFNWRTPLLLSTLARVPTVAGRGTLLVLSTLLLILTVRVTAHEPLWVATSNVMQAGALLPAFVPGIVVLGEFWSGALVGLSVCLFARGNKNLAVASGLCALFVRELAAPYCVACGLVAFWKRRWHEVGAWCAGACAYGAFYAWHITNVRAHQLPTDLAHQAPWLSADGVQTLLLKVRWQGWLLHAPPWATALALTVVTLGIVSSKTPLHARLASGAYIVFFMVAGQPFSDYWGLVAWPAWALTSGYGFQEALDAARAFAAFRRLPPDLA